jgi:hypothetical protein
MKPSEKYYMQIRFAYSKYPGTNNSENDSGKGVAADEFKEAVRE